MIDPGMISGAAVGTLTDMTMRGAHKMATGGGPDIGEHFEHLIETSGRIEALLKQIVANSSTAERPQQLILVLQANNFIPFNNFDRPYTMLFAKAITPIIFDVPGIGQTTLSVAPGWNQVNLPKGTMIALPNGATSVSLLFRAGNVSYGDAI